VVIPTLNEAANLPFVLSRIPEWVDEVIIVDGLSKDDTVAVAKAWPRPIRIVYETQGGKGRALSAGFASTRSDIIVALDADGSTDPAEIPSFVGALVSGADVALGTRFIMGGGSSDMEVHRKLGNHALRWCVRLAFGARYSDLCYGYMAFWRDVLPELDGPHVGFEVETMLHIRARQHRLRVREVASYEERRISGTSNLHALRDGWSVLQTIIRERRRPQPQVAAIADGLPSYSTATPSWVTPHRQIDLTFAEADGDQLA
jgi:glycosyltransferase involved in cell wall biosynthesis